MVEFVHALLELLFFPFDKSDSVLFVTIFGVFLFCFSFAIIKLHTAVTNGHRCGGERPLCGASGQSVNHI